MDEGRRRREKYKVGRFWIMALSVAIRGEAEYPTRRKLRGRVEALRKALQLVKDEFGDALVLQVVLGNDDQLRFEFEYEFWVGLRDRIERVEKVLAQIPRRGGRNKFGSCWLPG